MGKSRASKQAMQPSEVSRVKAKSKHQLLKDMHSQGKENMAYGKEMMLKGHLQKTAAKMMMGNSQPSSAKSGNAFSFLPVMEKGNLGGQNAPK